MKVVRSRLSREQLGVCLRGGARFLDGITELRIYQIYQIYEINGILRGRLGREAGEVLDRSNTIYRIGKGWGIYRITELPNVLN